jgi:hypothetical protein
LIATLEFLPVGKNQQATATKQKPTGLLRLQSHNQQAFCMRSLPGWQAGRLRKLAWAEATKSQSSCLHRNCKATAK